MMPRRPFFSRSLPVIAWGVLLCLSSIARATEPAEEPATSVAEPAISIAEPTPEAASPAKTVTDAVADTSTMPPAATADATSSEAASKVELRYKYQQGQVLKYAITDASTVEMEYASEQTTASYETNTWKSFRIKSMTPEGAAVMELMFDRIHMIAEGIDGRSEFDSNLPGTPPAQFSHVLDNVGRPTAELTVNPLGRITNVLINNTTKEMTKEAAAEMALSLDRDAQSPLILPEHAVGVGDVWKDAFEVYVLVEENRLTRRIKLQRVYELISIEDGFATIEVDTLILTPLNDSKITAQLIQRTPSGVIVFDMANGWIASKRTFLNNQVVGHEGPGSKLKIIRTYTETVLAPQAAQTAQASP